MLAGKGAPSGVVYSVGEEEIAYSQGRSTPAGAYNTRPVPGGSGAEADAEARAKLSGLVHSPSTAALAAAETELKKRLIDPDSEDYESDESITEFVEGGPKCYLPMRYVVLGASTMCLAVLYGMRTAMSVTASQSDSDSMYADFNWGPSSRGLILSSYFWGYISTQILGGVISNWFGPKTVFCTGLFFTSALTAMVPMFAHQGFQGLLINRVLVGMFEGITLPALFAIVSAWTPSSERTTMVGVLSTGPALGVCAAFATASLIEDAYGWETVFYVYGGAGFFVFVMFVLSAAVRPVYSSLISQWELAYLIRNNSVPPVDRRNVGPWKDILGSPAVWALLLNYMGFNWIWYTLLTELPSYMRAVLGFHLHKVAVAASLPFVAVALWAPLCSFSADRIISRGWLSRLTVRKSAQVVGMGLTAVCLVLAGYTTSPTMALVLMVCILVFNGTCVCGVGANTLDIGPRYAPEIISLANMAGTLPGILSPAITGAILDAVDCVDDGDSGCSTGYRYVFVMAAGINLVCVLMWVIFAKAHVLFD